MMKAYCKEFQDVLVAVDSTAEGLSTQQAQERLAKYGPNKLKEAEKPTLLQRFLTQLKDPMLIILLVAAAVSAVTVCWPTKTSGQRSSLFWPSFC